MPKKPEKTTPDLSDDEDGPMEDVRTWDFEIKQWDDAGSARRGIAHAVHEEDWEVIGFSTYATPGGAPKYVALLRKPLG